MRRTRVPGFILIGMGIFFCLLNFIVMTAFTYTEKKCDMQTQGIVVDLEEKRSDGSTLYAPVVEYYVDDVPYTLYSNTSSTSYRNYMGREVTVLYNSDDPYVATLESPAMLWIFDIVFYGVGVLLVIIGLPMAVFGSKQKVTAEEMYDARY